MLDTTYQFKVKSAERTIKLIELISAAETPLTFTEIHNALGIPRSSLSYLVADLEGCGYLSYDEINHRYSRGMSLVETSILCTNKTDSLNEINLELSKICVQYNTAAHAGVLNGLDVTYIAKAKGPSRLSLTSGIGLRTPAHSTALGRVLLSEFSDSALKKMLKNKPLDKVTDFTVTDPELILKEIRIVRGQQYAVEIQQSVLNTACIAIPVRNARTGKLLCAISLTFEAVRLNDDFKEKLLNDLRKTADGISMRVSGSL